jgi:hypothetical protein
VSPKSIFYSIPCGFLALALASCGGGTSTPSNGAAPSPSPATSAAAPVAPSPLASVPPSGGQPLIKASDPQAKPIVPATIKESASGLMPVSDSEVVLKAAAKGRTDPFAKVVLQSFVETTRPNSSAPNAPKRVAGADADRPAQPNLVARARSIEPAAPVVNRGRVGSGLGAASAANLARSGNQVALAPRSIPSAKASPSLSAPPALVPVQPGNTALRDAPKPSEAPKPSLASNIRVTGVAQVNGQTQVILKLPNESFSRYVSVGERVLDGKVWVKRVENPSAITPIVILEEVGVEVPRKVGEKIVTAQDKR